MALGVGDGAAADGVGMTVVVTSGVIATVGTSVGIGVAVGKVGSGSMVIVRKSVAVISTPPFSRRIDQSKLPINSGKSRGLRIKP